MYVMKATGFVIGAQNDCACLSEHESPNQPYRVFKTGRVLTLQEEQETWTRENHRYILSTENHVLNRDIKKADAHSDDCILMQELSNYCDSHFKKCGGCGKQCSHPSGKCSGSCADCLKEIQYHRSDGRSEYDCRNMLRYYTCHTIWKRCSEMLYALDTIDLEKYPNLISFRSVAGRHLTLWLSIKLQERRT